MTLNEFTKEKMYEGYGWEDVRIMALDSYSQAHNVQDWRRLCFKVWQSFGRPQ